LLVVVPREFADALVRRIGDAGRRWVEAVPALAKRSCGQWQIELTGDAALYGDNNLLLPARHATDACMLKLCVPGHDAVAEVTAPLCLGRPGRCGCRKPAWETARSCWNS
jgi:streptomycin 6-kinase